MNNIISGIFIICIGIFQGGSIFTGDPTGIDYAFDTLGIGFILYGIYQKVTGKG